MARGLRAPVGMACAVDEVTNQEFPRGPPKGALDPLDGRPREVFSLRDMLVEMAWRASA